MTDELELKAYRERVDAAACSLTADVIFNGSIRHAQIVIAALLRNAKKEAIALAGGLNNEVWGHPDTIEAAKKFLDGDGKLSIMINEDLHKDANGRNYFRDAFQKRFTLLRHDVKTWPVNFHVLETDATSMRLEPDKLNRTAMAFFNQPERVKPFRDWLAKAQVNAQPYAP